MITCKDADVGADTSNGTPLLMVVLSFQQVDIETNGFMSVSTHWSHIVDNTIDREVKKLNDVLQNFSLIQHVKSPTYNFGHTLDLIISKSVIIYKVSVIFLCHFSRKQNWLLSS